MSSSTRRIWMRSKRLPRNRISRDYSQDVRERERAAGVGAGGSEGKKEEREGERCRGSVPSLMGSDWLGYSGTCRVAHMFYFSNTLISRSVAHTTQIWALARALTSSQYRVRESHSPFKNSLTPNPSPVRGRGESFSRIGFSESFDHAPTEMTVPLPRKGEGGPQGRVREIPGDTHARRI